MVQRRKMVYLVIFEFSLEDEDGEEYSDTSIHGVFSTMEKAKDSVPSHDEEKVSYFIIETPLNEVMEQDEQDEHIDKEEVEKILMEQVKLGLVEQFVDENGNFVYEPVEKKKKK